MMRFVLSLLFSLFFVVGAQAQTGAVKTLPQLQTEIGSPTCSQPGCLFPDNATQLITPFDLRQGLLDMTATFYGMSGDCVMSGAYIITCTKTGGAAFVASATIDTTNASNITSGSLALARLASIASDTYLGQTAAGTPAAFAIPSCTGALTYALGVGFGCSTIAGTGTVTSVAATAGPGLTISGSPITTTGTLTIGLSTARQTLPTTSQVTPVTHNGAFSANSSGTYTTPANVLWIEVMMVGGGGGGGANSAGGNGGQACWNTSGAACTSPVYAANGGAGAGTSGGGNGAGTSGNCNLSIVGGGGGSGSVAVGSLSIGASGGTGGNSSLGGGGFSAYEGAGGGGAVGSGAGGAGAGTSVPAGTLVGGGGGGAGGTCKFIINSPAATYTYFVGGGGGGGGSAGNYLSGGAGGSGQIFVIEHYGS